MRRQRAKPGEFPLKIHQQDFSNEEVLLNPDMFPDVKVWENRYLSKDQVGDLVEIFQVDKPDRLCILKVTTMEKPRGAI